jgi:hypothetical protein
MNQYLQLSVDPYGASVFMYNLFMIWTHQVGKLSATQREEKEEREKGGSVLPGVALLSSLSKGDI